jgi:CBS domain-containing protein
MTVRAILDEKGRDVVTIAPHEKLSAAVRLLSEHRIGALVVTNGGRIAGILSERDIVRLLGAEGAGALETAVSEAMTGQVKVCGENSTRSWRP